MESLANFREAQTFQQNWTSQIDEYLQNAVAGLDLQPVGFYSL